MIPFPHIPSNIRIPLFRADIDPSKANTAEADLVSLVVGQMNDGAAISGATSAGTTANGTNNTLTFSAVPAGVAVGMTALDRTTTGAIPQGTTVTAVSGTVVTLSAPVAVSVVTADAIVFADLSARLVQSQQQANAYFGRGSMLARMYRQYRLNDPFGTVWFQPLLDDPASVKASGTIVFSGAPSASGVVSLYVAGMLISIAVTSAMSSSQVATAVAAAITAVADLPVTAGVSASTVTCTAKNAGAVGNDIDLRLNYYGPPNNEATPAGLNVAITAMASGATNPSTGLINALALLANLSYDYVANPYNDTTSLNTVRDWLNDVAGQWSYLKQRYGGAFGAKSGTLGGLQTFGAARNNQHESVIGYYNSPSPSDEWAAAYAGAAASSLKVNPAVPLQYVPIQGVLAPPRQSLFAATDRNTLLYTGVSTFRVQPDGTVIIENAITTYQTDPQGNPDNSYLEVETLYTLSAALRFMKTRFESDFPRSILVDDDTRVGPGVPIVTPKIARNHFLTYYAEMEQRAWVQDRSAFAAGLIVERNETNPNRLDVLWDGILSNQLRVLALLAQFRLRPDPAASADQVA